MTPAGRVTDRRNDTRVSCFCCLQGLHQIDTVASVPTILQAVRVFAAAVS